jgi:hypothetical protein
MGDTGKVAAAVDETFCYASRCDGCGRMTFAHVITPGREKYIAQSVAEVIASGRTVERLTTEEVRKADWMCECEDSQRPLDLAEAGED